ncbi:MAG: DUF3419 family protein [Myxococcota bacterium]|nr:DUF3419 family protein [Myxococcota bacterium]
MRDNPLQFAVVREDPDLEVEVVQSHGCRELLLIASGGCTALTLQAAYPDARITLVDPNPAQLDHVRAKVDALRRLDGDDRLAAFNVESDEPGGLSESGNFEALFRGLRGLIHDLVLPAPEWRAMFEGAGSLETTRERVFAHPCWPVAFEMYFSESLLNAMFGPEATQYAEPGSYPRYFRNLFERGLQRPDARDNPFLHHVFLGHYLDRDACRPRFLSDPPTTFSFRYVQGWLHELDDLSRYDLVDLSNILDWMAPRDIETLVEHLCTGLRPGAVVMWRQLNNRRNLQTLFGGRVVFDRTLANDLYRRDRSLFYSSLHIGTRS